MSKDSLAAIKQQQPKQTQNESAQQLAEAIRMANATDSDQNQLTEKLAIVKRRGAEKEPRKMKMTEAQPPRKRRRILTESENLLHKNAKAEKTTSE